MCRLSQAFDPAFAALHVDANWVDDLSKIEPLGCHPALLLQMKNELPQYRALAAGSAFPSHDVAAYSSEVLAWWNVNAKSLPNWALAARRIFSLAPSSAASERVFARVRLLFGECQMQSLADRIQAALMLSLNQRVVG